MTGYERKYKFLIEYGRKEDRRHLSRGAALFVTTLAFVYWLLSQM